MYMNRKKEKFAEIMNNSLWDLPSPSNMSYFWNFGSMLGMCLLVQMGTGILLTFHYTSNTTHSFSSVVEIMRDVWNGWLVRFIHMNGASTFFLFMYLHLFRGVFYLSSVHAKVWTSGVMIMMTLMGISFMGYVLPWGQMSYWAVAVITNLLSIIPVMGDKLVVWVWGDFSVGNPTLMRFYSLHFLTPFILTALIIIHLSFLHKEGSSNSLGVGSNLDKIKFHPYFTIKDLYFILMVLLFSLYMSFFYPYMMGDSVNNVPASSLQTPVHIQPEWYFLPSYAILRSMPSKASGVLALLLSVTMFFLSPIFKMNFSTKFSFYRYAIFWCFMSSFLFLMKMGSLPAEAPLVEMGKWGAMIYFSMFMMINL